MKATEFRIGNYVYWTVPENHLHFINSEDLETDEVYCVAPIPLSEEWLTKFGFSRHENTDLYLINIQELGLKKLVVFSQENKKFGIGFADYYTGKEKSEVMPLNIYFVHQLQNLYFALTGEELTIK